MLTLTGKLPNRDSLSIGEAVAHTGISQRAILHGELPIYMADGHWRVPTAAVRAYLEWQHDGLPVDCGNGPFLAGRRRRGEKDPGTARIGAAR